VVAALLAAGAEVDRAKADYGVTALILAAQNGHAAVVAALLAAGAEVNQAKADGVTALILAAQKVEHYEIATYGRLARLSKTLGRDELAGILATTLENEKKEDSLLADIAESSFNCDASEEEEDD
jgi:ferritin-like metal-binding protein YciE